MEELAQRIEEAGWSPLAVPLLELARALGPLIAQMLFLGQPFLGGVIGDEALERAAGWLDDPSEAERLLSRLERRNKG